jgi:hypothetical protein
VIAVMGSGEDAEKITDVMPLNSAVNGHLTGIYSI